MAATTDDFDDLPVADDFQVIVRDSLIEFTTSAGERLAWFPAWEHADRDLRHFVAADVPIGSLDRPFEDADDAWCITIFEHAGYVHVFEGDAPGATEYPRAFRVLRDQYLEAWARLIDAHNPVLPLALDSSGDV